MSLVWRAARTRSPSGDARIEGHHDASKQADGIVVADVERQPRGLAVQPLAPSAQQRRLSVAGTSGDEYGRAMCVVERPEETLTAECCVQ